MELIKDSLQGRELKSSATGGAYSGVDETLPAAVPLKERAEKTKNSDMSAICLK